MNRYQRVLVALVVLLAAWLGYMPAQLAAPLLMGVTAATTDLDELMKITFADTIISEVVTDTELLDQFPDGEVITGSEGRYFELAHLVERPGSVGSRSEGGYVPVPNSGRAVNGRVNLKKVMGSLEETAEVLKKIKGDRAAFVNWAEQQFPYFKESLMDEIDRQLLGDSSGIRARVNDATPATTLTIDSTFGVAAYDKPLLQFQKGMFLRASANADGSSPRATTYEVTDIDWDSDALIVNAVTNLVDDDYLFEGDAADNSAGKDAMGLLGMVDNGDIVETLQNINRSTELWFKSYVNDMGGDPLTEDALIDTDRVARLRGGGRVDLIVLSEEAFNEVWRDLRDARAMNDPRSYTAGRSGITVLFGGTRTVTLKTARKLPSTLVFGLQKNMFRKHVLHEFEWDDTTGAIWKQVVDSTGRKDAFYAYGSMYMEMAIKSPQKCWRAENFAISA